MAKAPPILTLTPVSRLPNLNTKTLEIHRTGIASSGWEQMRAGLSPSWGVTAPASLAHRLPGGWLPNGQLGLLVLVVSVKLDAITTKLLYFLQTIFPFAIS